ncbi:hypothetical protein LC612_42985 [Nostoc sp. CHAB 5834]|nr:hypothetical protein [Nostoc sp. CHAB 5834]
MTIFTSGEAPKVINYKSGDQTSAMITAKRKSERYVILTFSQSQNSTQILSFRYGEAYLRSTPKGYDLAINGNKVGKADGHNLTLDISATDKKRGATRRSLIVCKKS